MNNPKGMMPSVEKNEKIKNLQGRLFATNIPFDIFDVPQPIDTFDIYDMPQPIDTSSRFMELLQANENLQNQGFSSPRLTIPAKSQNPFNFPNLGDTNRFSSLIVISNNNLNNNLNEQVVDIETLVAFLDQNRDLAPKDLVDPRNSQRVIDFIKNDRTKINRFLKNEAEMRQRARGNPEKAVRLQANQGNNQIGGQNDAPTITFTPCMYYR